MFCFKFILGSFVLVAVFQVISSQQCSCQHRPENLGALPPSATEFLCKDLASAIQNAVLAKMRRTGTGPAILGPSGPSVTTTGSSVPLISTPGANFVTNSVNDISNPGTCPICARKWQNALARVLGMTGSTSTSQTSSLPVSTTSPVNVPLPYNVQTRSFTPQEYVTSQRNVNIQNAYPTAENVGVVGGNNVASFNANNFVLNNAGTNSFSASNAVANNFAANNAATNNLAANMAVANNFAANNAVANNFAVNNAAANNLAALLSRSVQNNANIYPEVVRVGNNGLRN